MKPVCETIVRDVLPRIRAIMARMLIEDYGFSQVQAAIMLDTTQPAISQYKKELRGKKKFVFEYDPEISDMLSDFVRKIASNQIKPNETGARFCEICKRIQERGLIRGEFELL
ncbi:MAG TPA: hypothetical protein ENG42_03670 [Candidatus Aenigmarchaeota archaeon]|nr:hypothetical protein [Candidatus Aenigmarchaeota archaeon]